MKKEKKITFVDFLCEDCGKFWEDYPNFIKKVSSHARKTGHKIRGEVRIAYYYYPQYKQLKR